MRSFVCVFLLVRFFSVVFAEDGGHSGNNYTIANSGGHHRTPSGGISTSLSGVNSGYLGMGGMGGMGGIHAAQAYGMATPRLMQASVSLLFSLVLCVCFSNNVDCQITKG